MAWCRGWRAEVCHHQLGGASRGARHVMAASVRWAGASLVNRAQARCPGAGAHLCAPPEAQRSNVWRGGRIDAACGGGRARVISGVGHSVDMKCVSCAGGWAPREARRAAGAQRKRGACGARAAHQHALEMNLERVINQKKVHLGPLACCMRHMCAQSVARLKIMRVTEEVLN